jgi:predicted metalloendopeptidase
MSLLKPSIDRPEQKQKKIATDNHSLDQFRVNIPLMNLPEFSEAWGCKLGEHRH